MSDFSQGKIYKIVSNKTNNVYIGSTTYKYLTMRMNVHRYYMKNKIQGHYTTANKILKYGDAKIILIEEYPCKSRKELLKREQFHIKQYGEQCINKRNCIPISDYSMKYGHINKNKQKCLYCDCYVNHGNFKSYHANTIKHNQNVKIINKILEE